MHIRQTTKAPVKAKHPEFFLVQVIGKTPKTGDSELDVKILDPQAFFTLAEAWDVARRGTFDYTANCAVIRETPKTVQVWF